MFNYFVTVHNSEKHLSKVLSSLVANSSGKIYVILDGCTDGSKVIAESFSVEIIETPNLRETLAINHALKHVPLADYNFILQDDVVLLDHCEGAIKKCFDLMPIGVLSMRHGADLKEDTLTNGQAVSERNVIQSEFQPYLPNVPLLPKGHIISRQIVYKSPICIQRHVIEELGMYDERFAPIAHDDTEYCIRALNEGYFNAVVALPMVQPLEWGGTRRHPQPRDYHQEHMDLLRKLYPMDIERMSKRPSSNETIKIC